MKVQDVEAQTGKEARKLEAPALTIFTMNVSLLPDISYDIIHIATIENTSIDREVLLVLYEGKNMLMKILT